MRCGPIRKPKWLVRDGEEPVDKSALAAKIAEAESKVESEYTEESWTALQAALATARIVNEKEDATQAEVDVALANLEAAIAGLELKPEDPPTNPQVQSIMYNDEALTLDQFPITKVADTLNSMTVVLTEVAADIDVTVTTDFNGIVVHEILAKVQDVNQAELDIDGMKAKHGLSVFPAGSYFFTIKITNNKGDMIQEEIQINLTEPTPPTYTVVDIQADAVQNVPDLSNTFMIFISPANMSYRFPAATNSTIFDVYIGDAIAFKLVYDTDVEGWVSDPFAIQNYTRTQVENGIVIMPGI